MHIVTSFHAKECEREIQQLNMNENISAFCKILGELHSLIVGQTHISSAAINLKLHVWILPFDRRRKCTSEVRLNSRKFC